MPALLPEFIHSFRGANGALPLRLVPQPSPDSREDRNPHNGRSECRRRALLLIRDGWHPPGRPWRTPRSECRGSSSPPHRPLFAAKRLPWGKQGHREPDRRPDRAWLRNPWRVRPRRECEFPPCPMTSVYIPTVHTPGSTSDNQCIVPYVAWSESSQFLHLSLNYFFSGPRCPAISFLRGIRGRLRPQSRCG